MRNAHLFYYDVILYMSKIECMHNHKNVKHDTHNSTDSKERKNMSIHVWNQLLNVNIFNYVFVLDKVVISFTMVPCDFFLDFHWFRGIELHAKTQNDRIHICKKR